MKNRINLVISVLTAGMLLSGCGGGQNTDSTANHKTGDNIHKQTKKIDSNILTINNGENITINQNSNVTLAANISDSSMVVSKYIWKEGNTILSTQKSFSKSDFSVGTHSVALTVEGKQGQIILKMITINIKESKKCKKPLKTGQIHSYYTGDDGELQKGLDYSYNRDDTKNIVTDNNTGLMWQDDESVGKTELSWSSANEYCSTLTIGGYADWRMPTVKELMSIRYTGSYKKRIDDTFQNGTYDTNYYGYWTSTEDLSDPTFVFYVDFGKVSIVWWKEKTDEDTKFYTRCVRK